MTTIDSELNKELCEAEKQGKKYILYKQEGRFWRIMACRDVCKNNGTVIVRKGSVGGLVGSEKNLSHQDSCWIFGDCKAFENARVFHDALLVDNASDGRPCAVYGRAKIGFNAIVDSGSKIHDDAFVQGDIYIKNSEICEKARLLNYSAHGVMGIVDSRIGGDALLHGTYTLEHCEVLGGDTVLHGDDRVARCDYVLSGDVDIRELFRKTDWRNPKWRPGLWLHDHEEAIEMLFNAKRRGMKYMLFYHKNFGLLNKVIACRDFGDVKAGDIGGYVEDYENLSNDGDCWIYDSSKAMGHSYVSGDSKVADSSELYDNVRIYGKAVVEKSKVMHNAEIYEKAYVKNAYFGMNNKIHGDAEIVGENEGVVFFGDNLEIDEKSFQKRFKEAQANGKKYVLYRKEGKYWRIMACRDLWYSPKENPQGKYVFVRNGEVGGLVESEDNLSHEGMSWVFGKAIDNSRVYDDAVVFGEAWGRAKVFDCAQINGIVSGDVSVHGNVEFTNGFLGTHSRVLCGKADVS